MTYRTLLVAVDRGGASDDRVTLARDLAVRMDAHLIGACGLPLRLPPVDDGFGGGVLVGETYTLFRDAAEEELRMARDRFQALVDGQGVRWEWRGHIDLASDVVAREARAADLVIVGRRSSRSPDSAADPADVLMAVGRPVLVVPETARDPAGAPAVVAWKDSREARRAVAAALPMLARASDVHVLESCEAEGREAALARVEDVVGWLARHGVPAQAHVAVTGRAGEAILAMARERDAGLIVAGGYGHSRLREWVLGGVTEELLSAAPVCLLLSH